MEKILKDLDCFKVTHSTDDKKLILNFVDKESSAVYKVNYNKQKYVNDEYVDDEKTAEEAVKLLKEETGCEWSEIDSFVGQTRDVYFYGNFSKLHHVTVTEKFTKDQGGELFNTTIKEITVDNQGVHIFYDWEDKTYRSNMSYGAFEYVGTKQMFFVDPAKQIRQEKKFEDYYGVPVSQAAEIIGNPITVEVVSQNNGKMIYGDIKKPKWGAKK